MKNKLIKYLIPVSAVVATTVPFMVSCGPQAAFTYELTHEWKPTIEPKQADHLIASEATDTYLSDAKQNPRIIADDFINEKLLYLIDERHFETITMTVLDINTTKKIMSIKIAFSSHYEDDTGKHLKVDEMTFSNIPIDVTLGNELYIWTLKHTTSEEWLKTNPEWSVDLLEIIDGKEQYANKHNQETVTKNPLEAEGVVNYLNDFISWSSYYLKEMIPG